MNLRSSVVTLSVLVAAVAWPAAALGNYHLERISPVLNQPTYLAQAPGDPSHILYYSTRISSAMSGFNAVNTMGKIWRFDTTTTTSTAVLDLSGRQVVQDAGLQAFAFHPDFNTPSAAGYGKIFVSSAERGSTAVNRVEEFTLLNANGTFKTPAEVFDTLRLILIYTNNALNNHTIDWIGFDPNASGPERNYLYISTGDGSYGNSYNGGISPNGRPSQNPAELPGKLLRVDISGTDDYPGDASKNFAIPPSNPIPTYNQANPGSPLMGANASGAVPALGEVYLTGLRNGYRVSFDRANSDLYWGDVGETAYEEVHFVKAGSNESGPPLDFGWPQLEGTHNSPISGAPHTAVNPFTGVSSTFPIREYSHSVGHAAIGGYVYRGPITELQGKYFYADFVNAKLWMLDFDRNTDAASFHGTNGTLTDVTSLWSSLISYPADTNYVGDTSVSTLRGLDHVVSFGEDNAGNLYVVDFGYGTGFSGQYTANAGELFKLVFDIVPQPTIVWTNYGTVLQLSWSGSFQLQWQTNGRSIGISTNWDDYPGGDNSPVDVPIDAMQESAFFRLLSLP